MIAYGYDTSSSGGSLNTIHWDLATQYLNKEVKGSAGQFRSAYIRHPYNKKVDKNWHIHSKMQTFPNGRKIDKEVIDGLFHAEEVENKHFEAFLLEKLVQDKKSFFQTYWKASLITGNEK